MSEPLFKRIKDWATSITAFRSGDVIPVDGPSGTAKMSKDSLLKEASQNTLVDNVAPAFDESKEAGDDGFSYHVNEFVLKNGVTYRFIVNHVGSWNSGHVEQKSIDNVFPSVISSLIRSKSFEKLLSSSVNLFDKSEAIKGYWNGRKITYSTNYFTTAPIFVEAGVNYKFPVQSDLGATKTNIYLVCSVKDNVGYFCGSIVDDGANVEFSVPYDCFVSLSGSAVNIDSFMVCKSSEYPNVYVPFNKKIPDEFLKVVKIGVNLFNEGDSRNISGQRINGPSYVAASNASVSEPIAVKKGVKYKITHNYGYFGNNAGVAYVSESDYVTITESAGASVTSDHLYETFTASKDGYIRFSYKTVDSSTTMFCEFDKYPESYVGYFGKVIEDDVGLSARQKQNIEDMIGSAAVVNPLKGKILAVDGDSICYGEGYAGGYARIIGDRNEMTVQNNAVSGATIAAETYHSGGSARHWICRSVENMRADADYIIFEGGVNDSVPSVGSITSGYNETLDDTTFAGAFEKMLRNALIRWPGKKIGYIAVHKMTTGYDSRGDSSNRYSIAKACCEKWGIPFCDLNVSVPAMGLFPSDSSVGSAIRAAYTKDGDGWHPNEDGYNRYYVDKIESWLKTL